MGIDFSPPIKNYYYYYYFSFQNPSSHGQTISLDIKQENYLAKLNEKLATYIHL